MLLTACYVYLFFRMRRLAAATAAASSSSSASSSSPEAILVALRRSVVDSASLSLSSRPDCPTPGGRGQGRVCELVQPKVRVDVSGWIRTGAPRARGPDLVTFVVEVRSPSAGAVPGGEAPQAGAAALWSRCCVPLALRLGEPRRVLAEATEEAFARLGAAFLTVGLQLDSGEEAHSLISVDLEGFLCTEAGPPKVQLESSEEAVGCQVLHRHNPACSVGTRPKGDPEVTCEAEVTATRLPRAQGAAEMAGPLGDARGAGCHVGEPRVAAAAASTGEEPEDARPLHLSSCCECLGLESSTIESVRSASMENLVELPRDCDSDDDDDDDHHDCERTANTDPERQGAPRADGREDPRGGRQSGSEDERPDEPGSEAREGTRARGHGSSNKPPNVLVYTGQDGPDADRRFVLACAALRSVLRPDHYTVYRLEEAPARAHPWPEHTRLLVLASPRPLPEETSERFLAYAASGGAVLALCSRASCGGVGVRRGGGGQEEEEGARVAQPIRFQRGGDKPDVILSAPTDGVIVGVGGDGAEVTAALEDAGCVEVWARLAGSGGEAVIVYQAYGEEGGAVVLCQVDLTGSLAGVEGVLATDGEARCKVLAEILCHLGLNCGPGDAPTLTPAILWALEPRMKRSLLSALEPRLSESGVLASRRVSLRFVRSLADGAVATPTLLPVVTEAPPDLLTPPHFDLETYRGMLRTRLLGRLVVHCEVVGSTMELLDGVIPHLPDDVGLIAIATRQTQGKGRGGNAWLSPVGCAMFTLPLAVRSDSRLGQHLPFLQHLVALAVVEGVRSAPGYEDIDLRVKWPNDIYYGSEFKVGGVLVNSTLTGDTFQVLIGCGVNVSNDRPTWCVNAAVAEWNGARRAGDAPLAPMSTAGSIASTVTQLERLVDSFQAGGPAAVLPLYYQRWLHSGTQVRLNSDTGPEATVLGLDDFGFLRVLSRDGTTLTLQPDGNSFDMTRNLIVCKQ
ncbi:biotin--protein ligase [Lethenteron reissneri]|uniref:biotin--protein ligase n=1 Tax=Lethenteron reissneri TaxID=7753 RepID=UPI002AB61FB7|nr:biotin--protein ligase [Lethenteron reissneri]